MGKLRARTEEEIAARKKDIVRSCEELLKTREFDEISLADIAENTAISRPSMYNYYQKKEDVFLDLMEEKYLDWGEALERSFSRKKSLSKEEFCRIFTKTLCEREMMMKLISMYLVSFEKGCDKEHIISFRKATEKVPDIVMNGVMKLYPNIGEEKAHELIAHIFIHIYGIYPSTHLAKNQIEALESAGLSIPDSDMRKVSRHGIMMLLDGFEIETSQINK